MITMAFLRNSSRLCLRTLRFLSKEACNAITDPVKLLRGLGGTIPMSVLKRSELKLNEWLKINKPMKPDDWVAARKDLLSAEGLRMREESVDSMIVNLCLADTKIDMAMEYLQHLWDTNGKMNLSAMTKYLKLCYVRVNQELNEKERKYLDEIYDTVRAEYPLMDANTGESCICAISKTSRWKESFELLDMIKLSCKPRSCSYSAIISAAFNNDEPDIGFKYLEEALQRLNVEHDVYISYLKYCQRNFEKKQLVIAIEKMFRFWKDRDVQPYISVIQCYMKTLEDLGWSAETTFIAPDGFCQSCFHRLRNFTISQTEFSELTRIVQERVMIGQDVYQKSTPEEMRAFLQFVKRNQPWDVVIDGLNVAHIVADRRVPSGSPVSKTVRHFVKMRKRVLVLGRAHMKNWSKPELEYIKKHAHIFMADNRSADDPYLLYATLSSGPNTMFVSRDYMRQHQFLLEDPDITKIFKYWQMTHRMTPVAVTSKKGELDVEIIHPPKYFPSVQSDIKGWHVPLTTDPQHQLPFSHEPPKSWVCLRNSRATKTNDVPSFSEKL